ncbi:MAG: polyphosphate kinase 1, partial [Methanomethylophilus sp.]|nr:polyphosphate kinase 1 [Methanomethylophilus sp.]
MSKKGETDLYDRSLYINREISWLAFNRRCLEEAMDPTNPVLERVKFMAICYGNMDEFFMIRMPGLLGADVDRLVNIGPDTFSDSNQLISMINDKVNELTDGYEECWAGLETALGKEGISI